MSSDEETPTVIKLQDYTGADPTGETSSYGAWQRMMADAQAYTRDGQAVYVYIGEGNWNLDPPSPSHTLGKRGGLDKLPGGRTEPPNAGEPYPFRPITQPPRPVDQVPEGTVDLRKGDWYRYMSNAERKSPPIG